MIKNVGIILLSFVFFFSAVSVFAQDASEIELLEMGGFVDKNSLYVMDFGKNESATKQRENTQDGNQIFIEQFGFGNNINAHTSSENSDLKLMQYGDENNISFMIDAKNLEGTIIQEGNNNSSFDFTTNSNQDISANLLQQGDNLHFERYGANSIGNNLKFIQTGDTKTIIVRNLQ